VVENRGRRQKGGKLTRVRGGGFKGKAEGRKELLGLKRSRLRSPRPVAFLREPRVNRGIKKAIYQFAFLVSLQAANH
jgi:hypothetical protein